MANKKCIVMFSGGLDSRLAIKIMQEQGFNIFALHFKLPVGGGCGCEEKEIEKFTEENDIKLKTIDCTKGKNLEKYWKVISHPKYGRGQGVNPCKDCRIFMLKRAKKIADKKGIDLIVTGEVLDERPMSQRKKPMKIVEEESGLKGRLLRPLSALALPEEMQPKQKIMKKIDKTKLYAITGRKREKQEELAKKFNTSYPQPAGGCLLCEKNLKKRFVYLFKRGIDKKEIPLFNIGRHFVINDYWVVLGRDKKENKKIKSVKKSKKINPGSVKNIEIGPTAIILKPKDKRKRGKEKYNEVLKLTKNLVKAYSKSGTPEEKAKFQRYKI